MKQEDIRKIWEWCGFKVKWAYHDFYELESPLKEQYWLGLTPCPLEKYPKLTLDNLFKYAVPKLEGVIASLDTTSENATVFCVHRGYTEEFTGYDKDPAEALAQAILGVLRNEN